jgi:hypothetical protein
MKNSDLPASALTQQSINDIDQGYWSDYYGLTKREVFAGLAMQGILSNPNYEAPRRNKLNGMAIDAVAMADALLSELAKEQD